MLDGYNRGQQWEQTCPKIAKLEIARQIPSQGTVLNRVGVHERNQDIDTAHTTSPRDG